MMPVPNSYRLRQLLRLPLRVQPLPPQVPRLLQVPPLQLLRPRPVPPQRPLPQPQPPPRLQPLAKSLDQLRRVMVCTSPTVCAESSHA